MRRPPLTKLAALARNPPAGTRLTYKGGTDRLGNPDATLVDCPCCGQAVRVELHGSRLSGRCFGGCDAKRILSTLDVDRIAAELRASS